VERDRRPGRRSRRNVFELLGAAAAGLSAPFSGAGAAAAAIAEPDLIATVGGLAGGATRTIDLKGATEVTGTLALGYEQSAHPGLATSVRLLDAVV
jgi:hypothetical protein